MKMVITGVENWSPDMIPVAFERKFDEALNEIMTVTSLSGSSHLKIVISQLPKGLH